MASMFGYLLQVFLVILLVSSLMIAQTEGQFTGWEDYINSWNNEEDAEKMFPFGEEYHDHALSTPSLGVDMTIDFTIPFYGRLFSSAYLDIDGHIELSNTIPATKSYKRKKTEWPNENYPDEPDPPFIAPYIAGFELTGTSDPGRLFWRRLEPSKETDASKIDIVQGMLNHLSMVVQQQVVGAEAFSAQNGLVATWSQMHYQGCELEQCPLNTLQAVVVTDGVHTFAIFNYYDLNWIGGALQGYDENNGRDCVDSCRPAQAGFNAGDAQAFFPLPHSNTDDVMKLAQIGGRFTYGVNSVDIRRGGCTNQTDVDPLDWPLVVSPEHGTMLGGQALHVSGPCFNSHLVPILTVHCKFSDIVVEGFLLDDDVYRALCVTPLVMFTGRVRLQLSTDQGATWPYTGWFTYEMPSIDIPALNLDHPEHWHSKTAETLAFDWEPLYLEDDSMFKMNVTAESNVDIRLYGFFETVVGNGTTGELRELLVMDEDIENTGRYEFIPSEHNCPDSEDCEWGIPLPLGLMEVRRRGSGATPRRLWSPPFPLGWYGNTAWEGQYGPEWADEVCTWWLEHEQTDTSWKDNLHPCPMTKAHAAADMGQFMLGHDCNATWPICPKVPNGNPEQMITCYDQVSPHSQSWPSISHCCYDQEGYLLYAGDSAHPESSSPAFKANPVGSLHATHAKVPMLSHYCWDKVFQTLCCEWTSDSRFCQDGFMKHRPTADMLTYSPPTFTTTFGDPHFRTFDGIEYTFNGRGEYWLLRIHDMNELENINVQARMESPRNQSGNGIQGTVMTVVAIQEGYADSMMVPIIEIATTHSPATTDLLLLIDSKPFDLASVLDRRLVIPYMENSRQIIVVNNEVTPFPDNRQSNITVIFQDGITIQVAFKDMALHVITGLPDMYKGMTGGLFGLWNDNKDDDLTAPSGAITDPTSSTEVIHNQFGQRWIIDPGDSRLTYRGQMDFNTFYDPDFEPHFEEPVLPADSPITEGDVDEACDDNFVCRFDYKTTMSRDLAITSANFQSWSREIVNISAPVPVCPHIEVSFSRREVTHYMVGGTVNFLGCTSGYTLTGPSVYTCVEHQEGTADWEPYLQTYCRANSDIQNENKKKIIAIVVPICVVCLAVGLGVGGYFIHKKRKKNAMADQTAYSSPRQPRPSLSANTLEVNFNPVAVHRPPNETRLVSQGLHQAATLAGSGALGSLDSFTTEDQIDTRMRSPSPGDSNSFGPDFTQSSAPAGYISNPINQNQTARSFSVDQVHHQNNYNDIIESAHSDDSHDYDSREFDATLSQSQVSLNYQRTNHNVPNNQHNQSSHSLNRSRPDLHQSSYSLNRSVANLNQSRQSFAQSHHDLIESVHLNASSNNLSMHHPPNQYVNLAHAPSVQSISHNVDPRYTSHASLNRSHTGYINSALIPDDTPQQAVPVSNFSAYTGGFGTDTTV